MRCDACGQEMVPAEPMPEEQEWIRANTCGPFPYMGEVFACPANHTRARIVRPVPNAWRGFAPSL